MHLDGLMLLPNGVPRGFLSDEAFVFLKKNRVKSDFTPYFMPLSDAHSPRRLDPLPKRVKLLFFENSYNPVIRFIIMYKS